MDPQPQPAKPTPIEFVKQKLSINPEATFAEIRAQAKVEGINVFPVVYGRAKALLGLVPTAAYGSKKGRTARSAKAEAASTEAASTEAGAAEAPQARPRPEPEARPAPAPALDSGPGRIVIDAGEDAEAARSPAAVIVEPGATGRGARTARAKAAAAAAKDPADKLASMVDDLRRAVRERDQYRALLQRLHDTIGEALLPDPE